MKKVTLLQNVDRKKFSLNFLQQFSNFPRNYEKANFEVNSLKLFQ